jgi:DNA mismatch endonuclease (patch repair protein)
MERALREKLPGGKFENVPPSHSGRMRAIRAKGAKSTERRLRALLVGAGVRGWKLHPAGLPGKPDFLFPDARLVVFVDGCYWHGCPQCGYAPTVNRPYWSAKIAGNAARDRRNTAKLVEAGLRVLRLWEHELAEGGAACVRRVRDALAAPAAQ